MKRKLQSVLLSILLVVGVSNAATTDNGQIAANIALTTAITVSAYPTNIATGAPAAISDGTGVTDVLVVDDIVLDDNSINGWTLDIVATNGNLLNVTDATTTIAYTLKMDAASAGSLGAGLSLGVADPIAIGAGAIDATGTATTGTVGYTFDILMTIADAATVGKLAGDYAETLTLTIASND